MKTVQRKDIEAARLVSTLIAASLILAMVTTSGCGVMGVREIDAWGLKMQFSEGLDFHVGANQIDNVDDRRGVKPNASYKKGAISNEDKY